jgi:lanosterol synthase
MVHARAVKTENSPNGNGQVGGGKLEITLGSDVNGSVKKPKLSERTDYSRWRLLDEKGRHTWHYLEDDEAVKNWPQTTADKYFLGLPTVRCRSKCFN